MSDKNFRTTILGLILCVTCIFMAHMLLTPAPVAVEQESIYLTPATLFVHITALDADGNATSMGSGVLDGNRVITAKHVLEGAACVRVLIDGWPEECTQMFLDPVYDLGVIRLPWPGGVNTNLFYPTSRLPYGSILVTAGGTAGSESVVISQGIYGGHVEVPARFPWVGEMLFANIGGGPGNSCGGVYFNNQLVGILVGNCGAMTISEPVEHLQEALARAEAAGFNL
jgi:hypothetical protein